MSAELKEKIKIFIYRAWRKIAPPFLPHRQEKEKLTPDNILPKLSERYIDIASQSAFTVFRERKFRELADFSELHQIEQDRIFNELEVTAICLLFFILDDYAQLLSGDDLAKREMMRRLRSALKIQFLEKMTGLGIQKQFVRIWEQLLNLRLDEYKGEISEIEAAFKTMKENFKSEGTHLMTRRTQIMAVGCHFHICRGQVSGRDRLYVYLLHWLRDLDYNLTLPLSRAFAR